jgi:hypothetical protein
MSRSDLALRTLLLAEISSYHRAVLDSADVVHLATSVGAELWVESGVMYARKNGSSVHVVLAEVGVECADENTGEEWGNEFNDDTLINEEDGL